MIKIGGGRITSGGWGGGRQFNFFFTKENAEKEKDHYNTSENERERKEENQWINIEFT